MERESNQTKKQEIKAYQAETPEEKQKDQNEPKIYNEQKQMNRNETPKKPVNNNTDNTPQTTVMEPSTVYGISKLAGERWCEYYHNKYGIDVRSIRYPGLISYKAEPGGGTTDYAVDIYYKALQDGKYECYLEGDTYLPMMYMEDAIKATIDLMHADEEKIKIRSSYNLAGISFSPVEISEEIKKYIPDFSISYTPDFRQVIANSWPKSINESQACKDWGWENSYDLESMTKAMLAGLEEKLSITK